MGNDIVLYKRDIDLLLRLALAEEAMITLTDYTVIPHGETVKDYNIATIQRIVGMLSTIRDKGIIPQTRVLDDELDPEYRKFTTLLEKKVKGATNEL